MANPTKPKEAKPRVEGEEEVKKPAQVSAAKETSSLVSGVIVAVVVALIMSAVNYFLMNNMADKLSSKISITSVKDEGEDADSEDEPTVERGVILDLGDFILNLADKDSNYQQLHWHL